MGIQDDIQQRVASNVRMRAEQGARHAIDNALGGLESGHATGHESSTNAPSPWTLPTIVGVDIGQVNDRQPSLATAAWSNPVIAAAMPALLCLTRAVRVSEVAGSPWRAEFKIEIGGFRRCLRDVLADADIERVSYLLCTFADEVSHQCGEDLAASSASSLSVQFHGDAWGGETCFTDLESFMNSREPQRDVLEFYNLVLSLGLRGRFSILDHGDLLLNQVRDRLYELLYGGAGKPMTNGLPTTTVVARRAWVTPWRVAIGGGMACLLGYAVCAWLLYNASMPVRMAILAFKPAVRPPAVFDIQRSLPPEITAMVNEGWLQVIKKPEGWLLLFTSDNAFGSAQEVLNADYRLKIARMGRALAPWPGPLEVVGHTDNQAIRSGRFHDNTALSVARATTVQMILKTTANVLQPNRAISAVGRGDSDPVADNTSDAGRRMNRRVDILWKVAADRTR